MQLRIPGRFSCLFKPFSGMQRPWGACQHGFFGVVPWPRGPAYILPQE